MKKLIKASSTTEQVYKLLDLLYDNGLTSGDVLEAFLDNMLSETSLDILKELADRCEIDWEEVL